jgi:ABC-type microcin C transport system duplicated ATPase subunit YejF
MGSLLSIHDLQVRFASAEAVRGISLLVDEGEVLGLVGESGSGKFFGKVRTCCSSRRVLCGGSAGARLP